MNFGSSQGGGSVGRKPPSSWNSLNGKWKPLGEPPTAPGRALHALLQQQRPQEAISLLPRLPGQPSGLAQKDRGPSWWPWSWSGTRRKGRAGRTSQPIAVPHLPRIPPALPWPPQRARPGLHKEPSNKAYGTHQCG